MSIKKLIKDLTGSSIDGLHKSLKGKVPTFSGWKLHKRLKLHGMDISIENRKGSYRKWGDKDHEKTHMQYDYGYIRNTQGRDKDHVDCYIGPNKESQLVYIVHQIRPDTRKHDEDKVMLGFDTPKEAKSAYLKHIPKTWFGGMDVMSIDEFKKKTIGKKVDIIKSMIDDISKGRKPDPIGTVRNGRKKVADGKWVPVKDGKTPTSKKEESEESTLSELKQAELLAKIGEAVWGQDVPDSYNNVGMNKLDHPAWIGLSADLRYMIEDKRVDQSVIYSAKKMLKKYRRQITEMFGAQAYKEAGLVAFTPDPIIGVEIDPKFKNIMFPLMGKMKKDKFKQYVQIHKDMGFRFDGPSKKWYLTDQAASEFKIKEYKERLLGLGIKLNLKGQDPEHLFRKRTIEEKIKKQREIEGSVDKVIDAIAARQVTNMIAVKRDKDGKISFYSPYSPEFNNIFSNKSGVLSGITEYNPRNHARQTYDINLAVEAMEKIKERMPDFKIIDEGIKEAIAEKEAKKAELQKPIPEVVKKLNPEFKLFDFQNEGVKFFQRTDGNALLGDEMGTGKTLMSLAWAASAGKKVLVVCPKVVRRTWLEEAEKFFPDYFKGKELIAGELRKQEKKAEKENTDLLGTLFNTGQPNLKDVNIATVNYESIEKFLPAIEAGGFDTLIVDESHRMKNPKAKQTQMIQRVAEKMKHKILLSGTAVKNKKDELFTQLNLIHPGRYTSKMELKMKTIGGLWHEIQDVYLARSKKDVLKDLPEKSTQIIKNEIAGLPDIESGDIGEFAKLKAEVATEKTPITIDFIKEIMDSSDSKVLVFSDSVGAVKKIKEAFGDIAIMHHGQMGDEQRESAKKLFQEEGNNKQRIFVSTRQSLAVGATLTAADKVVFNDLPWTAADLRQAEDRAHRVGQKNNVNVYWMTAKDNAFDESVAAIVKRKYELNKKINEGKQISPEEREWMEKPLTFGEIMDSIKGKKDMEKSKLESNLNDLTKGGKGSGRKKTKHSFEELMDQLKNVRRTLSISPENKEALEENDKIEEALERLMSKKSFEENIELIKGRKAVPVGTKSPDGKMVKTAQGWEYIKKEGGKRGRPKGSKNKEKAPEGTPLREAQETTEKQFDDQEEYAFARESTVGNKGEDLLGSARHKRNAWRTLEDAEKEGSAEQLVTRDKLLKNEPVNLFDAAEINPTNALTAYYMLQKFVKAPDTKKIDDGATYYRYRRGQSPTVYVRRINSASSFDDDPTTEVLKKMSGKEYKRELRSQYYQTFKAMSSAIQVASKKDLSERALFDQVKLDVKDEIGKLRKLDYYNPLANQLVRYHNTTLKSWGRASKQTVMYSLQEFLTGVEKHHGKKEGIATKIDVSKDQLKEYVKKILEGTNVKDVFGLEKGSKKGEFNAAQQYVDHAERKGPPTYIKSRKRQEDFILNKAKMRGLQWGNSVTDEEREHHLQHIADSFKDLTEVLGLPEEMGSFNGKLGLAIGARGKGRALAHYEPTMKVINLTRKSGVGSLAHEWGHFFDNALGGIIVKEEDLPIFSMARNYDEKRAENEGQYASLRLRRDMSYSKYNRDTGQYEKRDASKESEEMGVAFSGLKEEMGAFVDKMRKSDDFKRMSQGRKGYWSSTIEVFARSFERYVQHKLHKDGRENTYLVGLRKENHPLWPDSEDIKKMEPHFDKIFEFFKRSSYLKKAIQWVDENLQKGKRFPIGTVHNGFVKVAEGKWIPQRKMRDPRKEEPKKEEKPGKPQTSKDMHMKNGEYTEERKKLHKHILNHFLKGKGDTKEGERPVIILTGGGSASGKSSVISQAMTGMKESLVHVDADEIKGMLPEYNEMKNHKDEKIKEKAAAFAHAESSDLASLLIEESLKQNKKFLYDSTFSKSDKMKKIIEGAHKSGYYVQTVFADLPLEEAKKRSAKRAKETGRKVPEEIINQSHANAIKTLNKIHHLSDSLMIYSNLDKTPKLTYNRIGGNKTVSDEGHMKDMQERGHIMKAKKEEKKQENKHDEKLLNQLHEAISKTKIDSKDYDVPSYLDDGAGLGQYPGKLDSKEKD